jgi:HD superfamily phosphohydrolase
MNHNKISQRKIINDPVYGFITVPGKLLFDILEHPYFQRLRRIKQLGLTHYVYPSALHTRFQHALGCMHLMTQAIDVLQSKGHLITPEEQEGLLIAILLHDVGHGPYSHTLEQSIVKGFTHENLSLIFMDALNNQFQNRLALANSIFRDDYQKKFLHQLVSSQLDMDRLDYLTRDSFFTGVSEGIINTDRIIKMLNVVDDEIVVDVKGIYSIEEFIISRRLMYWQVYFHKTVMAAEYMLINILKRAKYLAENGIKLFATPALQLFLKNSPAAIDFQKDKTWLVNFSLLDDYDIFASIKVWMDHDDRILSILCKNLVNRHLYKIEIQNEPFASSYSDSIRTKTSTALTLSLEETGYFVIEDNVANNAYNPDSDKIKLLYKDNRLIDVSEASDQLNISVLSTTVRKYLLGYPKYIKIS